MAGEGSVGEVDDTRATGSAHVGVSVAATGSDETDETHESGRTVMMRA